MAAEVLGAFFPDRRAGGGRPDADGADDRTGARPSRFPFEDGALNGMACTTV